MKRVLIAGIGNVLLGDDGVGPYVVRQLDSAYCFDEGVALEDLGTPALDFIDHIAGLDALIVVDSVDNGKVPGNITMYRRQDLMKRARASHGYSLPRDRRVPAGRRRIFWHASARGSSAWNQRRILRRWLQSQ